MTTREEALAQLTAPGQPYEFVRAMQGGYEVRVFKNAPPTLGALFAENRSDLPFFVYDDERYSYEEAYAASCRIGRLLVDRYGIGEGDRVAISMRNYPEWVMCFMAVTSIGAIAVALNALWQPEEMEYGLIDSGAKVLFADGERLQRLAACSDAVTVQAIAARQGDGPNVRGRGARRPAARRARRADAAGRRRADRRRDDPLHVGLGGISEGRGEHAPERHHRAAVVGAGQRGGPDRRRPGMAQAGPSAGDAAGRAALPRHRLACGVPVVVPGAAQDRLDVQVGPGAGGGLDRAGAHRHVRRGAGDDGGSRTDGAHDVARPEFADDGGRGRGATGAGAGEGDRSVVRERLRARAGG